MPIPLAGAILGSSIIGGLASIFGAKQANDAAADRTAAMAANAGAANQAIGNAITPAFEYGRKGVDRGANYLAQGYGNAQDMLAPIAGEYQRGVNWLNRLPTGTSLVPSSGLNANINIDPAMANRNPYFTGDPNINIKTNFGRNPNIGGHWDDLRSQNFLQSPDYQFRKQEALDMVQGSAAGAGGLYSGQTLKDITDRASNLAAGEYGNWFSRQQGLADRDYGADVSNFDRAQNQFEGNYGRQYGQEADNYARAANQFADNYNRDYGQASDYYNRLYGQAADNFTRGENQFADQYARNYTQEMNNLNRAEDRYNNMINRGVGATSDLVGQGGNYYNNLASMYSNLYNQTGRDIMGAGYGRANNYMGVGQVASQQPYVSPWGGINQAVQGGLEHYLWAQRAGLVGQPQATKPQTGVNYNYFGGPA